MKQRPLGAMGGYMGDMKQPAATGGQRPRTKVDGRPA